MENKVLRRLLIVLTIIAILAFMACFGGFIYATVYYINQKNAHFVEEQATIVEYKKIEHENNYNYYNLYYEYVAPDGMKYTGLYDSNIKNFDYIEKKLNTKITIYVDYDKHIHRLNKEDFNWSPIAFLCLSSIMLFVFAMVPLLNLIKYYKTKNQNDNSKIVQEQSIQKLEKVENNKNVKKIKKPSYGNLASLVGVFIFSFALLGMILLYPQTIESKQIYERANFVKVYATIDKYDCVLRNGKFLLYSTYYVYESTEGTYEGLWQANLQSEEEAKAQLGKKVPIYVDHELNINTKKVTKNFNSAFIGITICTIIFSIGLIVSMVIMIKFITNSNKWKKYQESIKE